jgi:hypothetical protein
MSKLISVSDLFKNTWSLYRENFKLIVGLMALPFLLMAVSQFLVLAQGGVLLTLSTLLSLVAGVGVLWAGAGLIIVLRDRSQKFTIKETYRLGWRKLLPLVWVAILTMFIVGGSFILFVIPGIILMVWLLFAQILVITEDEKGLKAIVKSREYTRDYFWPILGRYLVMFVVVVIIYGLLMSLATFVAGLFGSINSSSVVVLTSLLGAIINVLVTPMALIYMYLVYESLKTSKGSVVVDPTKKQGIRYLIVGLLGWVLVIIISLFFMSLVASLLMGLFVGQALSGLDTQMPNNGRGSFLPSATLPAGLTAEQKQELQTQMEALSKLQDQMKQMKLPVNLPASE